MKPIGEPRWNRNSPPVAQRISAIRASSAVPRSAALQRRVRSRTQEACIVVRKARLEHASRACSTRSSSYPDYFENDLGRLIRTCPLVAL